MRKNPDLIVKRFPSISFLLLPNDPFLGRMSDPVIALLLKKPEQRGLRLQGPLSETYL
jgi:hypothetical protein